MKKSLLWIAALSLSLILGQTAFANDQHCGNKMMKMVENLNLDEAQKAKVKPMLEQLKSTMASNWSQMRDLHMQLSEQVMSDTMDQAKVDSIIDKKTKLMGDMMRAKMNVKHQIYTMLTAKQKENYQAMAKKWHDKMTNKMENCHESSED